MPEDIKENEVVEEEIEETPEEQPQEEPEIIDIEDNENVKEFLDDITIEDIEEAEEEEKEQEQEEVEEKEDEDIEEEEEKPLEEDTEAPEPTETPPVEEIIEKTTKKTLEEMGVSKEEKEELEEEGFKFAWEERGEDAPKDWREQSEETIRYWEYKKAKQDEVTAEKQKELVEKAQERNKRANQYWDDQLKELRSEGLLPEVNPEIRKKLDEGKILTKKEREDPGLKAQADIFEKMYEISLERQQENKPPVTDIHHIYYRYFDKGKVKSKKPAGAKAPVSGGTRAAPQPETEEISYDELHGMDFEDIVAS